ncbi:hypothetical protein ABT104_16170 [Streptomyces mobaraensis]|uniref:hypothetical protein n=1 Tax=Streptomyces mobaraensis TaxID=35621 RepID=UPI00331D71C6
MAWHIPLYDKDPHSPPGLPRPLLDKFAISLAALRFPLDDALADITAQDVEAALNALPAARKQFALEAVGIRKVIPRSVGRTLSQQVLERARRMRDGNRRSHAVGHITERVFCDLMDYEVLSAACKITPDRVLRWKAPLLRLACLSYPSASAAGAHLLLWAARQPWATDMGDPAVLDAACEAAERIVKEAEALGWGTGTVQAVTPGTIPAEGWTDVPTEPVDVPGDPLALYQAAEKVVAAARAAVERARVALDDGRPPSGDDLGALSAVAPALDAVRKALPVSPAGTSLGDLASAIEEHRVRTQDDAARVMLGRLEGATCAPGSQVSPYLADVREKVRVLLADHAWDGAARDQATVLGYLLDLVLIRRRPDATEELLALQKQIAQAAPEYSLLAVLADQVELPQEEPDRPAPLPDENVVTAAVGETPDPVDNTVHGAPVEPSEDAPDSPSEPMAIEPEVCPSQPPAEQAGAATNQVAEPTVHPVASGERERSDGPPPSADATRQTENGRVPGQGREAPPETTATRASSVQKDAVKNPGISLDIVLARLVRERRYGLAAHLSAAAERPADEARALRLAGIATALRHRGDRAATALVEALLDYGAEFTGEGTAPLLVLPALLRGALITGEHVTGAMLRGLQPRLPSALSRMAEAVGQRTHDTSLALAPLSVVLADESGTEQRLREAVETCRDLLRAPHIRYNRATKLVERWLDRRGLLGTALHAIVEGTADAEERAKALLEEISRRSDIESAIDRLDAKLRRGGNVPLEGAGRLDVRQFAERVREGVRTWHLAHREAAAVRSTEHGWAVEAVSVLRTTLLTLGGDALEELAAEERRDDPLGSAAASTAHRELSVLLQDLAEGARLSQTVTVEDPRRILDVELFKTEASPHGEAPRLEELLPAVEADWEQALNRQLARDRFSAVRVIAGLHAQGLLPGGDGFELSEDRLSQLRAEEEQRTQQLRERRVALTAEVGRAEAEDAVTPEQGIHLRELLADTAEHTESGDARDLSDIRHNLDRVAELIPRYRDQAAQELRKRLDALPGTSDEDREQVERNLEFGNLGTAAELLYFLELGEKMPEMRLQESRFEEFFPQVPEALVDGLTSELIDTVRKRTRHPACDVLDYSGLSAEEATRTADALERWAKLAGTRHRHDINPREDLSPAMALLGYQAKSRRLDKMRSGGTYRFAELYETTVTGRAWAPSFGSHIIDNGRKLRLLLVWGQPSARRLMDLVGLDPDQSSLLVVHFGTMKTRDRADLVAATSNGRPLLVVDDAALAYLAAHGRRGVDAATEILLPFSSVNPYIKEKRGRIGWEMFYGRDTERRSILDPDGTQILYGGRGLGKSALLADAGERFEKQRPGAYRKLYLNLDPLSISRATATGAEAVWPELERRLVGEGILTEPKGKASKDTPRKRVEKGVEHWLQEDPERRLLILLDECDGFFEADAVRECAETRGLRGLAELSEATWNRAKVVFAGLHSVQRFTRHVQNTPFNQMAQNPTVVGPLKPQFAADLLLYPMRALGYEFADTDLVNRVLGFCSYQPFLLQIFGHRLVRAMQAKRLRQQSAPPYRIDERDITAIEQDPDLRAEITKAFQATLDLDDCYRVVADVLAAHARNRGLQTRLNDRELRSECETWWYKGFHRLDSVSFRAYLEEMVGLGILAPNHDGTGWHLRGPNALRMLGTASEIESRLLRAELDCRLQDTVVLERRLRVLEGERSVPLTVNQIDHVRGEGSRNHVRVVLGSPATGIGDVAEALDRTTRQVPGWTTVITSKTHDYRKELGKGTPATHRLVISDLQARDRPVKAERCRESLAEARLLLPPKGAARTVALVSGTGQFAFWRELFAEAESDVRVQNELVVLKRLDSHGIRDWAQDHGLFETEQRLETLVATTGGWPLLLERAAGEYAVCKDQDRALSAVAEELRDAEGAERFVNAVGLTEDESLLKAYAALMSNMGTGWNKHQDPPTALEMDGFGPEEARYLLACLQVLQVFERNGEDLRLEPVLVGAWNARKGSR